MDKKNIDYFLICHDQHLILEYLNTNKFQYLPHIIFLFVGNSPHNLIDNLPNVIICKNLKHNIEQYPDLCSFTAWYAIEYNNLSSSKYICLLEYDINIENNFHNKNLEYLKNDYSIYGYFESLINHDMFKTSTPWIDIILKYYYDFELDYFIQTYCSTESYWHPTTNILIEKNIFSKYVRWFYNLCNIFANDKLGSYAHERMLAIYSHINKIKTQTITNVLTHKQLCSHGNKDLIQSNINYNLNLIQTAWLVPIDIDFDYNFYYHKYPDIQNWYLEDKTHSLKQKMFHHYFLYGKAEKRLKNNNVCYNLIDKISIHNIKQINNNLECICLLTTSKEIQNSTFDNWLKNFLLYIDINISKKIIFNIIINNNYYLLKSKNLDILNKIFKNVNIINLNLKPYEDIYISINQKYNLLPEYGLKSGPNIMFFKAIEYCKKYNTTLFLETDSKFMPKWLNILDNYIKYSNGFLISGAIYDGDIDILAPTTMSTHLNGGIALYATNNVILQALIQLLKIYIKKNIKEKPNIAYDYALKELIDLKLTNHSLNTDEKKIWKFINRNYVTNKLIFNYSLNEDKKIHIKNIIDIYNPIIIHKK